LAEGKLKGNERFPAEAIVTLGGVGLSLQIKGKIELETRVDETVLAQRFRA
jgi:hypothetical protein